MTAWLHIMALVLLLTIAFGLLRVFKGPTDADRMIAAQFIGTGGVATVLVLAAASGNWAAADVALILALLAAFASVAFVKAASRDGLGDPEEEDEP